MPATLAKRALSPLRSPPPTRVDPRMGRAVVRNSREAGIEPASLAAADAGRSPYTGPLALRFGGYPMCKPPLTEKSAPVANPDSSDATQLTIDAMSAGVPRRLTGMPAMILSSTSCLIALTMSVAM